MLTSDALTFKSPLHQMARTTPTSLWCDSVAPSEIAYSIEHGGVGATCNPVIALGVLRSDLAAWKPRIASVAEQMSTAADTQIGWHIIESMCAHAAKLLEPAFAEHKGRNGRLSIQTDPRRYRDSAAMVRQAEEFARLAPNIIVKIPATKAGIAAIEEATYRGISVNATVSFTVAQSIAVAEAVERGLTRRQAEGNEISSMGPVCTIMVGRVDDWLKVVTERDGLLPDPGYLEWAGVAVFKQAYRIYQERKYRTRLLAAAYRNHMQWSELIGGDIVISPPYTWQLRFNGSDIAVKNRIHSPVSSAIVDQLLEKFEDFRRAYDPGGLSVDEFDTYAPTVRTLRQFQAACSDLEKLIRDVLLPDPDSKKP